MNRPARMIDTAGLDNLLTGLRGRGFDVIGPRVVDGAVTLGPLASVADLPAGWRDAQDGGCYRLERSDPSALFDHVVGPHTWKRYLFPPEQRLWTARRGATGFTIEPETAPPPRFALIGVRACDLAALAIHDKVFDNGGFADPGYLARRRAAFIVAVNCGRPGGTCFCVSMGTGPAARGGFDIALTEIIEPDRHVLLAEAGSPEGAALLREVPGREAAAEDRAAADRRLEDAARSMGRTMPTEARQILERNPESPHWNEVATRCLNCANCTMVCPTCFCSTVEDTTDLAGEVAERWRKWDSCFSLAFSYIHGGSIRRGAAARYRQWITHKLSAWHEQFGMSGCTGCGRCITWCPVGIDITEEVGAIARSEGRT